MKYDDSIYHTVGCPLYATAQQAELADRLAQTYPFSRLPEPVAEVPYALKLDEDGLTLYRFEDGLVHPFRIDFATSALTFRRRFGGGRGQLLARAVGFSGDQPRSVVDATAGVGTDAFILASLGCRVTLIERHPVIAALLADGLRRAARSSDSGLASIVGRLTLIYEDAQNWLLQAPPSGVDVVYLDPMFPSRPRTARVKKGMFLLQKILPVVSDASNLLGPARRHARYRVVVKRPKGAAPLTSDTPSGQLNASATRFDLYAPVKDGGLYS